MVKLDKLITSNKIIGGLIKWLTYVAIALYALTAVIKVIGDIIKTIMWLGKIMGVLKAALVIVATTLGIPLWAVVAIIVALIAVIFLLVKFWKPITETFGKFTKWLQSLDLKKMWLDALKFGFGILIKLIRSILSNMPIVGKYFKDEPEDKKGKPVQEKINKSEQSKTADTNEPKDKFADKAKSIVKEAGGIMSGGAIYLLIKALMLVADKIVDAIKSNKSPLTSNVR